LQHAPDRRRFALGLVLAASQAGCAWAGASGEVVRSDGRVLRARDFIRGLGVNAHVSWPGHLPYADTERVAAAMDHLGVRTLRDHINSSTFTVFERLAAHGLAFDLLLNPVVGLDAYLGWARRLAETYPGSVTALEGPNEVDKWPVRYGGEAGYPAAAAVQAALHAGARADRRLARVPIYNLTVSGINRSASGALGDLSAHADFANVHPYYRAGQQTWGHSRLDTRYTLANYIASARWTAPSRPVVITETGSTTSPGSAIGVTEAVQARQILNSLFAAAAQGVAATYVYELADSQDGGPTDVESHYGLFRRDWTPKPAALALHNLTRILGRGRDATRGAAGPPPQYVLTGMPDSASSLLFRQEDGSYALVLWAEPDLWQEATHRPIETPAATVGVAFGADVGAISIFDPLVGSAPLRTVNGSRTVAVTLTDHPVIVALSPGRSGA
jgi:hypothetical protein